MGTIGTLLGALLVGLVALAVVLLGGMRAHWPPVVEAMRRLTIFMSKGQKGSGQPDAMYGLLRHIGRTSGTLHETPLAIEPTEDGVIAIVYGKRSQWVRNVLAAGSATIVLEGKTFSVDRPTVVPIEQTDAYFGSNDRRMSSLVGVTEALRLYHAQHD